MTQSPPEGMLPMGQDRQIAATFWRRFPSESHRDYADAIERGEKDDCEAVHIAMLSRLAAEARTRHAEDRVTSAHASLIAVVCAAGGEVRVGARIAMDLPKYTLFQTTDPRTGETVFTAALSPKPGS